MCEFIPLVRAAETPVALTLEAVPTTMKLATAEKGRIAVIARNTSAVPLRVIKFDHIASEGLSLKLSKSDPETSFIAAGSAVRWIIEIAQTDKAHDAGEVHFFVDYGPSETTAEKQTSNMVRATTAIQRIQAPTLDKVLEARVESAMKLLEDPNSGLVFVVVRNKSNYPISIRSIELVASAELESKWRKQATNTVIGPQTEEPFSMEIEPKKALLPGKHLLLFTVNADWTEDGAKRSGSTIAKHEFDAGVLGSSAMLTAVGVPSFLLLPGFLLILVFGMLWNLGEKRKDIPLDLKSPQFWAGAILLSLTTAVLYPLITGRDYLKGYSFKDVYYLWFGSAAVAALVWAGTVLVLWWNEKSRAKKVRGRTFTATDEPMEVLRKLARNGLGFELEQVDVSIGGKDVRAALLSKGEPGQPSWVAPFIGLSLPADEPVPMKDLTNQLKEVNAPAALAEFVAKNRIESQWIVDGQLRGVTPVPTYADSRAAPRSLVEAL
ncbi:MAG: hypothetical protein LC776_07640 [Acidobacteria bacterium]|nr:hypothetical protein [Acidobacteriota bacterium]